MRGWVERELLTTKWLQGSGLCFPLSWAEAGGVGGALSFCSSSSGRAQF